MRNDRWSKEEVERLVKLQKSGMTRQQIASKLGRSLGSVQGKMSRDRLLRSGPKEKWSIEEVETLKKYWTKAYSAREIGKKVGRTRRAVLDKAWRLGIAPHPSVGHKKFDFTNF